MAKKKKAKKVAVNTQTAFQQFSDYFVEMMVALYVFVLLVFYPLVYHNKYFDMGDAKYTFFKYTAYIFLGALIVGFVMRVVAYFKEDSFSAMLSRFTVTDWFASAFLVISYSSFICSENKQMAFWGFSGWNMGLLSQTIFVLLYFFVAKFWKWSPATLLSAMGAAVIAYLLAVIMRFGFDPLEMYTGLQPKDIEKFVSTLGQTTWYSSYAVLLFPVGVYWYCNSEKLAERIFSGIFIVLGSMSLCTVNSDSAYIAFVLIMMVFFWYSVESNEKFLKYLEVAIMILASCKLVGILQDLFPERLVELVSGEEKVSGFVTHSPLMLFALIIVAGVYIALRVIINNSAKSKAPKFDISKFIIIRKIMIYSAIVVIWLVILIIILTTNHKLPGFLNKFYDVNFFNFDEAWGNYRGFNWRVSAKAISNANFKDMFVGVGPDCFALAMDKYCGEEVITFWHGLKLACAHNEFLNMLVTEGILGVITYLGIMISSAVRCAKAAKSEPAAIFVVAIVAAYIGHNIFCYQQCLCTPILFLFMGIGEVIIRSTKSENK